MSSLQNGRAAGNRAMAAYQNPRAEEGQCEDKAGAAIRPKKCTHNTGTQHDCQSATIARSMWHSSNARWWHAYTLGENASPNFAHHPT